MVEPFDAAAGDLLYLPSGRWRQGWQGSPLALLGSRSPRCSPMLRA